MLIHILPRLLEPSFGVDAEIVDVSIAPEVSATVRRLACPERSRWPPLALCGSEQRSLRRNKDERCLRAVRPELRSPR